MVCRGTNLPLHKYHVRENKNNNGYVLGKPAHCPLALSGFERPCLPLCNLNAFYPSFASFGIPESYPTTPLARSKMGRSVGLKACKRCECLGLAPSSSTSKRSRHAFRLQTNVLHQYAHISAVCPGGSLACRNSRKLLSKRALSGILTVHFLLRSLYPDRNL